MQAVGKRASRAKGLLMHQLIALTVFLILTIGKTREPGVAWHDQLAFVVGSAVGGVIIFLAMHVVVFFAARRLRPHDGIAGFAATRLNYLTLALLVFIISAQLKH